MTPSLLGPWRPLLSLAISLMKEHFNQMLGLTEILITLNPAASCYVIESVFNHYAWVLRN